MLKSVVTAVVLLLSGLPSIAHATYISLQGRLRVEASLTKVAESTFDFAYRWYFYDVIPPSRFPESGWDPAQGGFVYYFIYEPGRLSEISGSFGMAMDTSGHGEGGLNTYFSHPGFTDGSFRMTGAPSGVLSLWTMADIACELWYPDWSFGGRNLVGDISTQVDLFGGIPTSIGEQTAWTVTPEPPTWALAGLLVAGLALIRMRSRRAATFADFPPDTSGSGQ